MEQTAFFFLMHCKTSIKSSASAKAVENNTGWPGGCVLLPRNHPLPPAAGEEEWHWGRWALTAGTAGRLWRPQTQSNYTWERCKLRN